MKPHTAVRSSLWFHGIKKSEPVADASVQTFLLFYVSRSLDSCQAVHTQHNAGDAGCLLRGTKNCLSIFGS
nr:MAG TPA: hypothetical protein [Caudoviricetes sp.]